MLNAITGQPVTADYQNSVRSATSNVDSEKLESQLNTVKDGEKTDDELMDVCKEFETYMLEQVYKAMEKTVPKNEDSSSGTSYMDYFGDTLSQEYSKRMAETTDFGLAQKLYDSMKR